MAIRFRVQKSLKFPKGINQEFLDEIAAAQSADLKGRIVGYQQENERIETFLKDEDRLNGVQEARENLASLTGPSNDAKKMLKNRTKAILKLLRERGEVVTPPVLAQAPVAQQVG